MAARPSTHADDAGEAVTSELDQALTLAPLSEPGSYGAELGAGWLIGNAVNGGLLMALAGRALSVELARAGAHPRPVRGQRLLPVRRRRRGPRPCAPRCSAAAARSPPGRWPDASRAPTASTWSGSGCSRRTATWTRVAHEVRTSAVPPDLPPPERCVRAAEAPPDFLRHAAMLDRLDLRLDPATAGWAAGRAVRARA